MAMQRVHYYNNQFLKQEEFRDEQAYHLGMRRALTRSLHTPGIARGLEVYKSGPLEITVRPGVAIDAQGRAIVVDADLKKDISDAPKGLQIWITIRYDEQPPPPADPTQDAGTNPRTVEGPAIGVMGSAPTDNIQIPLATFTIGTEIPGDTTTPLDGGVRAAHVAGAILAPGAIQEANLDPVFAQTLVRQDVVAGLNSRLDGVDTRDAQMSRRQDQLGARQDRIESVVGKFGVVSGLTVTGMGAGLVAVSPGHALDRARNDLAVSGDGVLIAVPGLDPARIYGPGERPQFVTLWVIIAAGAPPVAVGTAPPRDGSVVVLAKFDLAPQATPRGQWDVPPSVAGPLDGGARQNIGTTLAGDVTLQGKISTPMWRVTQVFNDQPGPIPPEGWKTTFKYSGGTLLIFASGSGYTTDPSGNQVLGMNILVNNAVAGSAQAAVNLPNSHMTFVSNALVVPPTATVMSSPADRPIGLMLLPTTETNGNTRFSLTVLELPF